MYLTLLDNMGIHVDRFGDSTGRIEVSSIQRRNA
jgi:hypothetical protein